MRAMKLGIIGTGNMASAIVKGYLASGADAASVYAVGHSKNKTAAFTSEYGIKTCADIADLTEKCDALLIAVKPKDVRDALAEAKNVLNCEDAEKIIISIAAGITTSQLADMIRLQPEEGTSYEHAADMINLQSEGTSYEHAAEMIRLQSEGTSYEHAADMINLQSEGTSYEHAADMINLQSEGTSYEHAAEMIRLQSEGTSYEHAADMIRLQSESTSPVHVTNAKKAKSEETMTACAASVSAAQSEDAASEQADGTIQKIAAVPKIIRVMPNTPAMVSEGMSALCRTHSVTDSEFEEVLDIFKSIGEAEEVSESLMDAVTGISGSGPAFVYMFIEALADGGVFSGLPRAKALKLAAQTVLGSAKMVLETQQHPGVLKDAVCSPSGTTIEGVRALENAGFRGAVMNAVIAAAEKSNQL